MEWVETTVDVVVAADEVDEVVAGAATPEMVKWGV